MDTRRLECFMAIANQKSFSRAAEELFITQPAITQIIKSLERELGVPLFTRTNKMVQLNEYGACLYEDAQEILTLVSRAERRIQERKEQAQNEFTIAYRNYEAEVLYAYFMPIFLEEYPEAKVTFKALHPMETIAALQNGEADVSVLQPDWPAPPKDDSLRYHVIFEDIQCAIVRKDHPLAKNHVLSPDVLLGERVFIPRHVPNYLPLVDYLTAADPATECTSLPIEEIFSVVRMGLGVGMSLYATRPNEEDLKTLPLSPSPVNKACMVTKKAPKAIVSSFVELAQTRLRDFPTMNRPE